MRKFVIAIVLVAATVLPSSSFAYTLTCDQVANAILNGDVAQQEFALGVAAGGVDVLAGLFCLGRQPQCNCLSGLIRNQTEAFSNAFATELTTCLNGNPSDPGFLPAMHAARDVCG